MSSKINSDSNLHLTTLLIFLSYNFGLPVIATDVGSFREDIIEGKTGFICKADDPEDLATKINLYFNCEEFNDLEKIRKEIIQYANENYAWDNIAEKTYAVYEKII